MSDGDRHRKLMPKQKLELVCASIRRDPSIAGICRETAATAPTTPAPPHPLGATRERLKRRSARGGRWIDWPSGATNAAGP